LARPQGSVMTLDAKSEAWLDRLLEQAPPLSEKQKDTIAACFRGSFTAPGDGRNPSEARPTPAVPGSPTKKSSG
jgi:hypothetical protein